MDSSEHTGATAFIDPINNMSYTDTQLRAYWSNGIYRPNQ